MGESIWDPVLDYFRDSDQDRVRGLPSSNSLLDSGSRIGVILLDLD